MADRMARSPLAEGLYSDSLLLLPGRERYEIYVIYVIYVMYEIYVMYVIYVMYEIYVMYVIYAQYVRRRVLHTAQLASSHPS
jgi:hypothetical protein